MSYLVFARKYRPQTFTDILGQEAIVTTLTNTIRQKRIAHAYLFAGPRGTGKTSTARIFAKALNCKEGPTLTPCLSCDSCQEITQGRSLDVLEIDGASNRGIDQIRTLRELAKFIPAAGDFKIYIIDEVHQITAEGFNALLKTLEEPPAHVLFILATTAPHKIPATILSRCQRYDFKRLPLELIAAKLKGIAAKEKLELAEDAAIGIARAGQGSLRDAESLLDQAASFTGGKIRGEDLKALLGTIDEDMFIEALQAVRAKDSVKCLSLVAQAANAGTDLFQWGMDFLSFLRNLLVARIGAGPLGYEEITPETAARLVELAQGFSVEELTNMAQILTGTLETMRRVGEPRILLEMALIRLASGETLVAVTELLDRLEKLDERLKGQVIPESPPSPGLQTSSLTLEQMRNIWPSFLEALHEKKASTAAYLNEAQPVAVEGADPPQIVVGFLKPFDFHRQALDRPETKTLLEQILSAFISSPVRFVFRLVEELPPRPAAHEVSSGAQNASSGARVKSPEAEVTAEPSSPPDPATLRNIADMFEGRVLPGTG